MFIREIILNKLREVIHPKGGGSIVTQGLVKSINLSDQKMEIILRLRSEDRGVRKLLQAFIMDCLTEYEKDYTIKVKFERNKNLSQKSVGKSDAKFSFMFQKLALFSTKGSIGQTTFAMNLAIALSKLGYHVALLDADLYGPDLTSLLGKEYQPFYTNKKIFLFERHGVSLLSLRKLMEEKLFISWRGSCVEDCLQQHHSCRGEYPSRYGDRSTGSFGSW